MTSTTEPGTTPAATGHRLAAPADLYHLPDLVACGPGRPTQDSHSPLDGSLVGAVPVCTPDDVAAAVESARAAQREWAAVPLRERRAVVGRFHALLLQREAEILDLVQAESGKSRLNAFEELADAALTAAYYRRTAGRFLRPARRTGAAPGLTRTAEYRIPKGVVGIISPWNYPLTLAVSDAIPALLAGNACVLKPDSQTPFTALLALELLREAGLPRDLFQIVTGDGPTLGPALISGVDFLMFTGSSETGRIVAQQCAERLIGFSGELGGKNATLVLADADLDKAARGAAQGCFSNSGQLCISMERIYVHRAVFEDFLATFTAHVEAIRLGSGPGWDIDMGSLTGQRQLDRVSTHVEDARAKGARVITGGRPRPDLGPYFYEPTILTGVTGEMVVAREETFGPVVAVYQVEDNDEAVALANDSHYGLNASVWSARHGRDAGRRLLAGAVNINDGYSAAWASHDAPMGGMKDSGVGRRHGKEGILKYTEAQTVAQQRLVPVGPPPGMTNQRYTRLVKGALTLMGRLR
ncbi:succinate-semialdehyde dehydrogenase/glutarate-semialdehyde dehydrogenase [Pseudarthrobacter oxydans]|uniref:Succinate-semialdehyde dehydrogenase/glutarate-semialdehyde dehydrogenase n=1 Tax=Pseudarthrobacter oxydans TaxID=1671 RepID=A0AAW8N6K5_PSEOX|nr:succinic semialdehyde dehydrogenase [Pseudarthrobacter oxydans]MDR6791667.1 succinate-semialdehyde dehydrogenase/glutarate-semialdehyde dehydrogenase [Pseudarthrobacter oxydans]MDR7163081.1 succinate-semialdehyde dehydrogenase/glutarate-semialdehyde dehydrogenase [Pseudarthrobacter oxydans]